MTPRSPRNAPSSPRKADMRPCGVGSVPSPAANCRSSLSETASASRLSSRRVNVLRIIDGDSSTISRRCSRAKPIARSTPLRWSAVRNRAECIDEMLGSTPRASAIRSASIGIFAPSRARVPALVTRTPNEDTFAAMIWLARGDRQMFPVHTVMMFNAAPLTGLWWVVRVAAVM